MPGQRCRPPSSFAARSAEFRPVHDVGLASGVGPGSLLGCVRAHTALVLATVDPLLASVPAPRHLPCLVPIANRPLLFRVLDELAAAGIQRVLLGVPPVGLLQLRAAGIERERWALDLHFRVVAEREDPVRALAAAHADGRLDGAPTVLHLADCRQPGATLSRPPHVGPADALLFVTEAREHERAAAPSAGASGPGTRWRPPPGHRLTGVQVLSAAALEAAAELARERHGAIGVERLADRVADRGGRVATVPVADCWRFGGRVEDVLDENRRLLAGIEHACDPASLDETTVHGPAWIHPSARLVATLVRGPVVIGPRAQLNGSYVGPYTAIGADALVEGTEIENSIVDAGARLRHVGMRIEGSVIGREAQIGRDFRLPQALRLWVGDHARITLA
jgi:glucose-1-phosphate thymidylyltransferase